MSRIDTMVVENENGPVIINVADFDPTIHKLPGVAPAENLDGALISDPVPLPELFVTKKGKKFAVTTKDGELFTHTGIEDSYGDETAAWNAILELKKA